MTNNISEPSTKSESMPMIKIPPGVLVASYKWHGTQLMNCIGNDIKVNFCDDLELYDFHASNEVAVIFLNEGDILSDEISLKRRLIKFCKMDVLMRKVVVVQRTSLTMEIYVKLQKYCAIDLSMTIIPVSTIEEAAKLLKQMVTCEAKRQSNPFRVRPQENTSPDDNVLATLQAIPGYGDKKALLVIEKFSTLENIANASENELAKIVGPSVASSTYKFFNNRF